METFFKVLGVLMLSFTGLCLVDSNTRGNPKINNFFSKIQNNYNKINKSLEVLSFTSGLKALSKLYWWISIVFLALSLFSNKLISKSLGYTFFLVFVFTLMSWFSINWFIDHKKTLFKGSKNIVLIILSPIVLGVFDLLIGEKLTSYFFIWNFLHL